jgi:hypothetical protein
VWKVLGCGWMHVAEKQNVPARHEVGVKAITSSSGSSKNDKNSHWVY